MPRNRDTNKMVASKYRTDACRPEFSMLTVSSTETRISDAWTEKYAPLTVDEVCGNQEAKDELTECILNGSSAPVVCYGGPGIGKITTVRMLLRAHDFAVSEHSFALESNLKELENDDEVEMSVLDAMWQKQRRKALLCTDVCCLSRQEKQKLYTFLRTASKKRLCLTIDDSPQQHCHCVLFDRVPEYDVAVHLAWIAAQEEVPFDETCIPTCGDVRACVNALRVRHTASQTTRENTPYTIVHRCAETLQTSSSSEHDDPVDAISRLTDAITHMHNTSAGYHEMMAFHAAGVAKRFHFAEQNSTANARHAQTIGRQLQVRQAWREWGLSPVDGPIVRKLFQSRVMANCLKTHGVASAHALGIVCAPNTAAAPSAMRKKIKTLVDAASMA